MLKMSLEKEAYVKFKRKFDSGEYKNQRFGQAFYNEFQLHKMKDQKSLKDLYELDGFLAENMINSLFTFE